jgi:predicted RNA-binding Zn-ribbon protein involved in translation (DUF1610 family)
VNASQDDYPQVSDTLTATLGAAGLIDWAFCVREPGAPVRPVDVFGVFSPPVLARPDGSRRETCFSCGAEIDPSNPDAATRCVNCGATTLDNAMRKDVIKKERKR